jgi:hypothetical protein
MKNFDVQGIDLNVPQGKALAFIADPAQLPRWTNAFASVTPGRAVMRTPSGEVMIDLKVEASLEHGTVDWRMTFQDRSVATAFSRVVEIDRDRCIFSFVLTPPPVPLPSGTTRGGAGSSVADACGGTQKAQGDPRTSWMRARARSGTRVFSSKSLGLRRETAMPWSPWFAPCGRTCTV